MENDIQKYNVLCVTKRRIDADGKEVSYDSDFHIGITGVIEIFTQHSEKHGVKTVKSMVRFNGNEYELLYVGEGLSGSAVTISIKNFEEQPYGIWQFYTDTSIDETKTPEELREMAKHTVEKKLTEAEGFLNLG